MELHARIHEWPKIRKLLEKPIYYSVSIDLPHKAFDIDSNNYKTSKQAKRSAKSLAARMGWELIWEN